MAGDLAELLVPHAAAWRAWLAESHGDVAGVWLVLARKAPAPPTGLRYDEALREALCFGWIDGQVRARDGASYAQRFTPRRPRSRWSLRNVELAESLIDAGLMAPAGLLAVEAARRDGRWEAAYPGSATAEVPADLAAALDARPAARLVFDRLDRANRYAVLYRVGAVRRPETRRRRIEELVAMLAEGRTIHPRRSAPAGE